MDPQTKLIEDLQERLAFYERDYAVTTAAGRVFYLVEKMRQAGLMRGRRGPALVGLMMYDRYPTPVSFAAMDLALPPQNGEFRDTLDAFKVYVSVLRSWVGKDNVQNVWGVGYRLTAKGREIIRKALEE